ncbi:hypothetical protein a10_00025 [Streptomyces acidiscabies]|nr:hypothetical protein a10_00025 [Streptomyces acidiscabies]GAV37152.1 hypothetical protein Saa2_00025 [Streptomyces acidiscabies]
MPYSSTWLGLPKALPASPADSPTPQAGARTVQDADQGVEAGAADLRFEPQQQTQTFRPWLMSSQSYRARQAVHRTGIPRRASSRGWLRQRAMPGRWGVFLPQGAGWGSRSRRLICTPGSPRWADPAGFAAQVQRDLANGAAGPGRAVTAGAQEAATAGVAAGSLQAADRRDSASGYRVLLPRPHQGPGRTHRGQLTSRQAPGKSVRDARSRRPAGSPERNSPRPRGRAGRDGESRPELCMQFMPARALAQTAEAR